MTEPAGLDAAILQGTQNARDIAVLADSVHQMTGKLGELSVTLEGIRGTISDQAEILRAADGLAETVAELVKRFNAMFPPDDPSVRTYSPIATPRFWTLRGEAREQAIARLAAWVEQVYLPTFGYVAASLPPCWRDHPLCLTLLDVASELHSCLYLQPTRNQGLLSGQAELLTRLMPALADLMSQETRACESVHGTRNGQVAWR